MNIVRWLDANLERLLVALLLAGIVLLITANVIMRYVLNASLSWGEELTLWVFVWFVWLSVSYAFQQGAHVQITFLRDLLSDTGKQFLEILVDVLVLGFLIVLIIECLDLMSQPFVLSQKSVVLGLPIPILYASAPVGAALSAFRVFQHLLRTLRVGQRLA
ncbi:TRAP transporter small permease [Shimia abyssi]|uniref:TRAP transporter small permease protein n=1 Tax=Shimia abyssi TaxID=1662395 RepID=A0A2P8F0Y8_9RHOB|nr:TRAP transporter small permease [Shimia abyssi]PSL15382.1 TRAP-type C4-dicarboxylate transport system permease small subunit [Shimia abyssi]